jgi:hypothetical protein
MFKTKLNGAGFSLVEVVAILLFIILVLAADGWFAYERPHKNTTSPVNPSAAHLTITRTNPLHQPGVSDFTKTASNSSSLTLLHDINSLKPVPSNAVFNCPNDDRVNYVFTFTNPTLKASASATGCQQMNINDKVYFSTSKFWSDVNRATHQAIDPNMNF